MKSALAFISLFASAHAGTVLWSGFFNASSKVSDFDAWSFGNEIGNWQWYIHGSSPTANYLALSASNKNPADTTDAQGVKTTIDGTAFWNGQTMERTEILPQTTANLGTGHLYYHFSLKTSTTNAPNPGFEHQIAFFESHFTELKFGLISGEQGTTDSLLRWDIGGVTQWSTTLQANNWYNFAYDIDFSGGTIGLWASNGSAPLTQIVAPIKGSPSTNSADWHIGVLRLPNGGTNAAPEDWYWSGIYVEQAPITTSIAGPKPGSGGSTPPTNSSSSTTATTVSSTASSSTASSTTTAAGPMQTQWGQCGGTDWKGPTVCASPYTCKPVSPPYYSQCQ